MNNLHSTFQILLAPYAPHLDAEISGRDYAIEQQQATIAKLHKQSAEKDETIRALCCELVELRANQRRTE